MSDEEERNKAAQALALIQGGEGKAQADEALSLLGSDAPKASEEAGVGTGVKHALKGYGTLALDLADTPAQVANAVTTAPRYLLSKAMEMAGQEEIGEAFSRGLPTTQDYAPNVRQFFQETEGIEPGSGWDLLQTGVEWGGAGPINAWRKGVWEAIPDALMAGGAALGESIGGQPGEVIGGFTGLLGSMYGRRQAGPSAESKAAEIITEGLADPDVAIANIEKNQGDRGTLTDLTEDRGAADIEEALKRDAATKQALTEEELARQEMIADQIRAPFGTADPAVAQEAAGRRTRAGRRYVQERRERVARQAEAQREAEALAESQIVAASQAEAGAAAEQAAQAREDVRTAERQLEEAALPLATDKTKAEASREASELFLSERNKVKQETIDPKWAEFDNLPERSNLEYKKIVSAFKDSLSETQRKGLRRHSKTFSDITDDKITEMSPNDIQYVLDRMRAKIRNAYQEGKAPDPSIRTLNKLYKALEKQLIKDAPVYGAVKEAETNLRTRFDGGPLDDLRSAEPELFFRQGGTKDELGAVLGKYLQGADVPGMPEAAANWLKANIRRAGGEVDENFLREFESFMDTLPNDVRDQARNVIAKQRGLDEARATAEAAAKDEGSALTMATARQKEAAARRAKAEKDINRQVEAGDKRSRRLTAAIEKSQAAKYAKDPKGTLDSALKPKNINDFRALVSNARKTDTMDSFQSELGDAVLRKLQSRTSESAFRLATDAPVELKTTAINDFNDIAETLHSAGMSADQIQDLRNSVNKLATKKMKSDAVRANLEQDDAMQRTLASGGTAVILNLLPGNASTSLVLAGRIRSGLMRLAKSGDKQTLAAIEDFVLNPEKYVQAAKNAKTEAEAVDMMLSKVVAASQIASPEEKE